MAGFVTKTIRWNKNYLLSFLDNHLIHYPTPINLTYAWSFGSSAGICLVIQILSGIFEFFLNFCLILNFFYTKKLLNSFGIQDKLFGRDKIENTLF